MARLLPGPAEAAVAFEALALEDVLLEAGEEVLAGVTFDAAAFSGSAAFSGFALAFAGSAPLRGLAETRDTGFWEENSSFARSQCSVSFPLGYPSDSQSS